MKVKSTQTAFFKQKLSKSFGGNILKSNPKNARPLSTKESIHLVLKSHYAVGNRSMLQVKNVHAIDKIIRRQAKKCGIKIYEFVNVGNHIHLVVRLSRRHLYSKFIRAITGLIARHVMKKERGLSQGLDKINEVIDSETKITSAKKSVNLMGLSAPEKFWVARPFSRIISWGKDFKAVIGYMSKNKSESHWQRYFIAWGFEVVDPVKISLMETG